MKITLLSTVLASSALAAPMLYEMEASRESVPTVLEAADEVRTLVHRESLSNIATIAQHGDKKGDPLSMMEYYADCDDDGTLTFLSLKIGSSWRNIADGSPASVSIRVGDHAITDHVNPRYPGSIVFSPAGSPRVSLGGKFVDVDEADQERLTSCFVHRHHDAKFWLPGNDIHESEWKQFKVDSVFLIGGFGDRAYIGEIPLELYQNATVHHHKVSNPHHDDDHSSAERPHHFDEDSYRVSHDDKDSHHKDSYHKGSYHNGPYRHKDHDKYVAHQEKMEGAHKSSKGCAGKKQYHNSVAYNIHNALGNIWNKVSSLLSGEENGQQVIQNEVDLELSQHHYVLNPLEEDEHVSWQARRPHRTSTSKGDKDFSEM